MRSGGERLELLAVFMVAGSGWQNSSAADFNATLFTLRLRLERKLRKRLRNLHNSKPEYELSKLVQKYEVQGLALAQALQTILLDRSPGWFIRGEAARAIPLLFHIRAGNYPQPQDGPAGGP